MFREASAIKKEKNVVLYVCSVFLLGSFVSFLIVYRKNSFLKRTNRNDSKNSFPRSVFTESLPKTSSTEFCNSNAHFPSQSPWTRNHDSKLDAGR